MSLIASVVRVGSLVMVAGLGVFGAGPISWICDCPATCSPVVCIDAGSCAAVQEDPAKCEFTTCNGAGFTTGTHQFVSGTYTDCTCTVKKGMMVNGVCVQDPNGVTVRTELRTGYFSIVQKDGCS